MSDHEPEAEPWKELEKLAENPQSEQVEAFLDALSASDAGLALSRLSDEDRTRLVLTVPPEAAAELVEQIPEVQAVDLIEQLEPSAAAAILRELPSDEQADLLGEIGGAGAEAILAAMDPEQAAEARSLSLYSDDVAGGLMRTEYLAYRQGFTVGEVIEDFRVNAERYRNFDVQYAYVTDASGRLVGVLRLRDLLLGDRKQPIESLMIESPVSVLDTDSVEELDRFYDRYAFFGVPVVDATGRLVGIVRRAAVEEALAERSERQYRETQGIIGGEELRTMPLLLRSRRRLAWLGLNVVLNVMAASVIAMYQETLAAVIALAVFLPIISDMSGCSGNQAVAVSMRELSLGLVRPSEVLRVWLKEISVGCINGLALGLLVAATAWLWKGNAWLGLVVGGAMALNTLVAVSIGGTVPLILRRLRMDPALASGPILTTLTDMCGFFLVLSFATALLPRLT